MSLQICAHCLARATIKQPPAHPLSISSSIIKSSFTTSAAKSVNPPKKTTAKAPSQPERGQKQNFTKKSRKPVLDRGKRPAIGERKALRKRVVLSNNNALEVREMEDFTEEMMTDEGAVGQVVRIPDLLVDQLRVVEAFKPCQGWSLFRRPAMLVRRETVEYGRLMEEIAEKKTSVRRVLVGDRGSGKSVMLLQAMTMAMMKGWVVINIADAMDLTIAHTEYAPLLPATTPLQYTQPNYTATLLRTIGLANPILKTLRVSSNNNNVTGSPKSPLTLFDLCTLGSTNPSTAWPLLLSLLSELKLPNRPPLLFTLDGLGFAMHETKYIDGTQYKPIHAHAFTLIAKFLGYLSGREAEGGGMPNGGMVLAATSESNRPKGDALALALGQIEAGAREGVRRDPFKRYDERVMGLFRSGNRGGGRVQVQRVEGVGKGETRALMEYWARSGLVRARVGEREVAEKWSIAGGGVVGELERACVRMKA